MLGPEESTATSTEDKRAPMPLAAALIGAEGATYTAVEAHLRAAGFVPRAAPLLDVPVLAFLLEDPTLTTAEGLELCRIARTQNPVPCTLVVATERDEEAHLQALVDAGADGLFVFPDDLRRLKPRFAALHRRLSMSHGIFQARRDLERRHNFIYDRAPIILHSIDADMRLVSVSDGWLEAFGYSREEVLGRCILDLMTEASRERGRVRIPLFFKEGVSRTPYEFVRKDGSVLEVQMNALVERDQAGEVLRTFAVSIDLTQVRRVERELLQTNQKLEALIHAFPDNLYRVAEDGTLRDVHFSAWSTGRAPVSALLGRSLRDFVTPEHAAQLDEAAAKARATKTVVTLELDFRELAPEGRENIREVRVVALPNGDVLGLSRDLSEQRRAQNALRQNQARLRALLDSAPVILWAVDRDGIITLSEGQGLAAFDLAAGELVGTSIYERAELITSAALVAMVRQALEGHEQRGETTVSGLWFEHGLWPLRDEAGTVTGAIGVSTNITDRRRAEFALRESERLAAAIIDNAPIGIQIYRPDGVLMRMNESQRQLFGFPTIDYNVERFNFLTDPHTKTMGADAHFRRACQGQIVEIHDEHIDFDAPENTWNNLRKSVYIDATFFPIRDGDKTVAVVLFCRDVTERKRAGAHLLLADRLASLGTMAAGVAHEINNPLAFVLANLEFIAEALAALPIPEATRLQAAQATAESIEGAHRMRAIVRDLSTFARSDDDDGAPHTIDVHRVLDASIRIAAHSIRHRATVARHLEAKAAVLGSEARLGQVFVNLLVNAAQAMPDRPVEANLISVITCDEPGTVVVEIHDNGVGIPPDRMRRIFDPFFTTKPVGEGTGLGLSICHSIVTSLGGQILVTSEPGTGSIFRVLLPVAPDPPSSRKNRPQPSDNASTAVRLKVLFVDDEPFVCAAVRRMIGRHFDLTTVDSADEALRQVRENPGFDAIICDLMMPGSSGPTLYRALLDLDPSLDRRVGFLTGGAFTNEIQSFAAEVNDRLLTKPFEPESLHALIHALAARDLPPKPTR